MDVEEFLVLNHQNDALIKRLTLFSFCNHPSTHFSFTIESFLNAHYFLVLHQFFKFKRFSWNISHIYANIEFKGLGLWFFDWQFFFSIVHLSLPLTITHFSTYYMQYYDNKKVVEQGVQRTNCMFNCSFLVVHKTLFLCTILITGMKV